MSKRKLKNNKPQRSDDGNAFIPESALRNGTKDDLAQQLAEDHQRAVTTGEDDAEEARDVLVPEEIGGPFIVSGAADEFGETMQGEDVDPSDDTEVEVNPFPQAVGGLAIASAEAAEQEEAAVEAHEEQTGEIDLRVAGSEVPSPLVMEPTRLGKHEHLR